MSETAYKLKMSAPVAAYMKGKAEVALKLPLIFKKGDHLFMVEWAGGQTGRADLCVVDRVEGNLLYLHRGWCWQQQKFDDDLSDFSLTLSQDEFKMVDKSTIPEGGQ